MKKPPDDKKLQLKDFEHKVNVRPLCLADFEELIAMQALCFPGMAVWPKKQIESQLRNFADGQICVEYDGRIVASASSLIVDFSEYSEWHNWSEIADSGYIRNHDPDGNTLYGIEIMVHPDFRGMKLARRLYEARKQLARERNLQRIIIGGRIPGYSKYADDMTAQKYVEQVMSKDLVDPVLTPQVANSFVLKGLIPNYFPSDNSSKGYATHLEWVNLEHEPREHAARSRRHLQAVQMVRLCVVQYELRPIKTFQDFADHVEFFVDVASDYHADFLLFPELFTLQLLSTVETVSRGKRRGDSPNLRPST